MSRTRWLSVLTLLVSAASAMAGTLAQFRTTFGDIEVELYDQDKPATVQNFIRYIQSGRYRDEFAHRLVPGFVIQGGGFTVTNRGTTNWAINAVTTYPPLRNEFGVGRRFSNVFGTIAMAKAGGDTNSASSQWFINLAHNPFLDANDTNNLFVVFGHVIKGTNVLNVFNGFQNWYYAWVFGPPQSTNVVLHQYFSAPFDDLPELLATVSPSDTSLLFIDITLLQVALKPATGGGKEISWNSAAGMTNVVEFTTNLPPSWNTLVRTNGTGARMAVVDAAAAPARRFYRVRVE